MLSFLLALVTFALVIISLFMVLVILMQRAKSDGGVGAALGGGMAESAFGGETANVLTKATQIAAILFFVLAFGLYLGRLHQARDANAGPDTLLPTEGLLPAAPAGSSLPDPAAPVMPTDGTTPAPAVESPSPSETPAPAPAETPATPAPQESTAPTTENTAAPAPTP